jgi:hypothetical protein
MGDEQMQFSQHGVPRLAGNGYTTLAVLIHLQGWDSLADVA